MSRRDFLRLTFSTVSSLLVPTAQAAEGKEKEPRIQLSALSRGPEDIYIVLFENNKTNARYDDDFIAGAAKAVGYGAPFQWHVEIMYFSAQRREWMFMGCRPPKCSMDLPALPFLRSQQNSNVRVNQLHVPVNQQKQARAFFKDRFQGEPFALTGPTATNCADVPTVLANELGLANVRRMTKKELLKMPVLDEYLRTSSRRTNVEDIMKRPDIVFPDEFENVGRRLGILDF